MNPAQNKHTKIFFSLCQKYVLIKIKNTIPFAIAPKMKYLGVNPIEYVQKLCAENHKTAVKEITK